MLAPMPDVGVTWPKEEEHQEGPAAGAGYVPLPGSLDRVARTLVDAASLWEPDRNRTRVQFVASAFVRASRDLGYMVLQPEIGGMDRHEAALYRAMYHLPGGGIGLKLDDVSDPRDMSEIALKLAVIHATAYTLPRMESPRFARAARDAADSTARRVMAIYDQLEPPRRMSLGDPPEPPDHGDPGRGV